MSMKVFANGREVAGKASDGKSVACFPDVCISPPPPIAGPVPIPYPNTAFASDTTSGSKTVKLHGKEAMLKDKSFFKKSTGDEPATRNFGAGVVTHQITGKVYFASYSMDVFIEGENVVRHLDLTTHNHGSVPGNTATWPFLANTDGSQDLTPCEKDAEKEKTDCKKFSPHGPKDVCQSLGLHEGKSDRSKERAEKLEKQAAGKESTGDADYDDAATCMKARRCQLAPYKPVSGQGQCCPGQTAHHMVPASAVFDQGRGGRVKKGEKSLTSIPLQGVEGYDEGKAPCVCVEGTNQNHASHGRMHTFTSYLADRASAEKAEWIELDPETIKTIEALAEKELQPGERSNLPIKTEGGKQLLETRTLTYQQARDQSIEAHKTAFGDNCSTECLKAQLDAYHKTECGMDEEMKIKTVVEGRCKPEDVAKAGGDKILSAADRDSLSGISSGGVTG